LDFDFGFGFVGEVVQYWVRNFFVKKVFQKPHFYVGLLKKKKTKQNFRSNLPEHYYSVLSKFAPVVRDFTILFLFGV
jgi:hypothetical protein